MPDIQEGRSTPRWVTFTDEETGDQIHLQIVLFRTLQPGRHMGFIREVLVVEQEQDAIQLDDDCQLCITDESEEAETFDQGEPA